MNNKEILCFLLNKTISLQEYAAQLGGLSHSEWKGLLSISSRYGLKPLIYSNLKSLFDEELIPLFVQEDLREAHLISAYKNTLIFQHTAKLLSELNSENISVIGLKGIFLLENIYNNIAARSLGDVDILVRKEDLQVSINVLETLGYAMESYFSLQDENSDIKHAAPMKNPEGLSVEIHWTILNENEPFDIDPDDFWTRAIPVKIADVDVLALSPEDLLIHLCLHFVYQHHLNMGLRGLNEIVEVLRCFNKQMDWSKLIAISRKWGVENVIWLALSLAEELLSAPVPPESLSQLKPEKVQPWVLSDARSIMLNARERSAIMTPDLADFANKKGFLNRIKIIISRIFLPKKILARLYGISPTSIKIYGCYFRRLKELIMQYGPAINRVLKKDDGVLSSLQEQQVVERLQTWMVES